MTIPIIQVDAFTETAFGGNPAAVVLLDAERDDAFLQSVAVEMNLSETAFPLLGTDGRWSLRWFTPATEVDLCGHATLATAHVLFDRGVADSDQITFDTRSGPLICHRTGDGILMDFPAAPAEPCDPIDGLAVALGVPVVDQGRSFDLVAQLESARVVANLSPDMAALAALDTRAVAVTAAGDVDGGPADFVSRVFAPRVGIPEDPVTGSAHCITGPWWAERLGRNELRAHQVSARGGRLHVKIQDDRVEMTGRAITVLEGHLLL